MSRPSERKRAKHDKRRADAKQRAKARELPTRPADLVALAATKPFGPCWIAQSYHEQETDGVPSIVQIVVTRRIRGELLLPACVLVDRTCLGIKNGFALRMGTLGEVTQDVERMGHELGDPLRPCEILLAQSVVFHAVDYARSLGFAPHRDAPMVLFEPRPEVLLDTLHARPARPFYMEGIEGNSRAILARLDNAVGPGNYDAVLRDDDDDEYDDDEYDEGEYDDDMLLVDGVPFMPVRLYYDLDDADDARAQLEALRTEEPEQADLFARVVVAGTRTLTVETMTPAAATTAAASVAARLRVHPHRVRIVNQCFVQDEGTPAELATWLDRDVTIVDTEVQTRELLNALAGAGHDAEPDPEALRAAIAGSLEAHEDVPLVEDFAMDPDDPGALEMLSLALGLRHLRARRHWDGDTDVTLADLLRALAERAMGATE